MLELKTSDNGDIVNIFKLKAQLSGGRYDCNGNCSFIADNNEDKVIILNTKSCIEVLHTFLDSINLEGWEEILDRVEEKLGIV